jgi:4-methylaminobutanoate oxidase (formaldehyde-forming)
VVYTQMLNARGGIECDLTVTRLADDGFYVVTGTGFSTHDFNWIERNLPAGRDVRLQDLTSAWAVLPLMGPRARAVLQIVTADDVSDAALPFGSARDIRIAGAPVRALRITYVGELGFELHVPSEYALTVFDALREAGRPAGLALAGYRAIETLRLEKGYRAWGADIGPDHSPLEAGLGFGLKVGGDAPFLGREALLRQRAEGLKKRLAGFTVDDPDVVLLGRETIRRDGERVGWLTSGGFGHTIGKPIGYGYVRSAAGVDPAWLAAGRYELEVATQRVPATLHLRPLYDPAMTRVKG